MTFQKSTLVGNEIEMHYLDAKDRWWLLQSPELTKGQLAVSSVGPGPEDDAQELRMSDEQALVCSTLDRTKYGGVVDATYIVDCNGDREFLSTREAKERYPDMINLERGESNQSWEKETTLYRL